MTNLDAIHQALYAQQNLAAQQAARTQQQGTPKGVYFSKLEMSNSMPDGLMTTTYRTRSGGRANINSMVVK